MSMPSALFWTSFALAFPQALWVRQRAPRFAEAGGLSVGEAGDSGPRRIRLLAVGDSIIAGVGARTLDRALVGQLAVSLAAHFQAVVEWQAFGKSGADARAISNRLPPAPHPSIDLVLVSVGVNDAIGLNSSRRFRRDLKILLQSLQTAAPGALLVFVGLPPLGIFPLLPQPLRAVFGLRATQFDAHLKQILAAQERVLYVPVQFSGDPALFSADGFHPSEAGYTKFAQIIAKAVADSGLLAASAEI